MKSYDFFEKMYLAESTFRGQILTLLGISIGITVAVASGFTTQVVTCSYLKFSPWTCVTFIAVAAATLVPLCLAIRFLIKAYHPAPYRFLDDPLLFDDYLTKLKTYTDEWYPNESDQQFNAISDEWVKRRLIDAASNNRTVNYARSKHLHKNHQWIMLSAIGTTICYVIKTLGT